MLILRDMDKKLVESYLDNIAELVIDEEKIVTYKSLSKRFGVHVNTAKQLLYTFLTKEKSKNSHPISATYLLAGKLANGSFNISIVNEADLKSTSQKFVEITSEHVYSIHKGKELKDVKVLCGTDKDLSNVESPLVIKCSKCILKTRDQVKQKQDSCQNDSKKVIENALGPQETVKLTEPIKEVEASIKSETSVKSPTKRSPKENSTKVHSNKKNAAGTIANLFAKATQKNAEKSIKEDKTVVKNKQKDIGSVNISSDEMVEAKEPDLKTEERSSGKGSSKSKKTGNKRKRIQMISDSEDSESNKEEETSPEEEVSLTCLADIEDKEEEVKEAVPRNKRKKRKVIDKTVLSEDGYLETRKEIVLETDSEDEVDEIKADGQQKKAKAAPVNDKGKGVQTASTAKKQSSLLTFFKKS